MESGQQVEIARRQAVLLARSRALRERLAEQSRALEHPLALADRARDGWNTLRNQPRWVLALGLVPLLPLMLRPRRLMAWSLRLWGAWRLWKQVRTYLPMQQAAAQPTSQPPWNPPAR